MTRATQDKNSENVVSLSILLQKTQRATILETCTASKPIRAMAHELNFKQPQSQIWSRNIATHSMKTCSILRNTYQTCLHIKQIIHCPRPDPHATHQDVGNLWVRCFLVSWLRKAAKFNSRVINCLDMGSDSLFNIKGTEERKRTEL